MAHCVYFSARILSGLANYTLLAEEQHKCQVGISKNERFNLSQHRKKKDLENTFKCEKIPFVYAQTKQPGGRLTKFQLE